MLPLDFLPDLSRNQVKTFHSKHISFDRLIRKSILKEERARESLLDINHELLLNIIEDRIFTKKIQKCPVSDLAENTDYTTIHNILHRLYDLNFLSLKR